MMPLGAVGDRRPAYVPDGFEYRSTVFGETAGGFWGLHEQAVLIYTVGLDWTNGLRVHVGLAPDLVLGGTEDRAGLAVALGPGGASTAVYHDGMWCLGDGLEARRAGDFVVHWNRANAHSVTVHTEDATWAIRGARVRGATAEELRKVAISLPIFR